MPTNTPLCPLTRPCAHCHALVPTNTPSSQNCGNCFTCLTLSHSGMNDHQHMIQNVKNAIFFRACGAMRGPLGGGLIDVTSWYTYYWISRCFKPAAGEKNSGSTVKLSKARRRRKIFQKLRGKVLFFSGWGG